MHNFSQDDLLTEDVLIFDTHAEVFVWIGQCVDAKEKQSAFEIGEVWFIASEFLCVSYYEAVIDW